MASSLYVCLQDEDKIVGLAIDPATGALTRRNETAVAGGPSVMALGSDDRTLYVGSRNEPAISSF